MPEAEVGMLRGGPWRDIETLWCIYLRIYGSMGRMCDCERVCMKL
jgi:hypothetical protein